MPAIDPTPEDRRAAAAAALAAWTQHQDAQYLAEVGCPGAQHAEDLGVALVDLIADLLHLADTLDEPDDEPGTVAATIVAAAIEHHDAETDDARHDWHARPDLDDDADRPDLDDDAAHAARLRACADGLLAAFVDTYGHLPDEDPEGSE